MKSSVIRRRLRERVVVTTKTGATFTGVLYEFDSVALILRETTTLDRTQQIPVDGELLLRWHDVDYLQRP